MRQNAQSQANYQQPQGRANYQQEVAASDGKLNYAQQFLEYMDLSLNIRKAVEACQSLSGVYEASPKLALINAIILYLLCIPAFAMWYLFDLHSTYVASSEAITFYNSKLPHFSKEALTFAVILLTLTPSLFEMATARLGQYDLPWIAGINYGLMLFDGLTDYPSTDEAVRHYLYPTIFNVLGQTYWASEIVFWITRGVFLVFGSLLSGPLFIILFVAATVTLMIGLGRMAVVVEGSYA